MLRHDTTYILSRNMPHADFFSCEGAGGGGEAAGGGAKRPRDTDLASLLKMKTAREMNAADVRYGSSPCVCGGMEGMDR